MSRQLRIVEHISSVWSYHLADTKTGRVALCGKGGMMPTHARLDSWGVPSQNKGLNYRYCQRCTELRELLSRDGR